jgi:hypothetical protein
MFIINKYNKFSQMTNGDKGFLKLPQNSTINSSMAELATPFRRKLDKFLQDKIHLWLGFGG